MLHVLFPRATAVEASGHRPLQPLVHGVSATLSLLIPILMLIQFTVVAPPAGPQQPHHRHAAGHPARRLLHRLRHLRHEPVPAGLLLLGASCCFAGTRVLLQSLALPAAMCASVDSRTQTCLRLCRQQPHHTFRHAVAARWQVNSQSIAIPADYRAAGIADSNSFFDNAAYQANNSQCQSAGNK
jgi:hypothetical protein